METPPDTGRPHIYPLQTVVISPLESLPGEIFNHILGFVFDPDSCATDPTTMSFGGYKFAIALLCVNKAVRELARGFLHHKLVWVRVDVNLPCLPLMDPHWADVRYITIPHTGVPKHARHIYNKDICLPPVWRSTAQDFPEGRIKVQIKFPEATTPAQIEVTKKRAPCVSGVHSMSVLVLGNDFPDFMRIVRINDLAYSPRILPGSPVSGIPAVPGIHGMRYDIQVDANKPYGPLLECFRDMHGTLHECNITGAHEGISSAIIQSIVHPVSSTAIRPVAWEAVRHVLWCSRRVAEYINKGMHEIAYAIHNDACGFRRLLWLNTGYNYMIDYFQGIDKTRVQAMLVPAYINGYIAHIYGVAYNPRYSAHFRIVARSTQRTIISLVRETNVLELDYVTMMFVAGLYTCHVQPATDSTGLDIITAAWATYYQRIKDSTSPMLLLLGLIHAKTMEYQHQLWLEMIQGPPQSDSRLVSMRAKYLMEIREILRDHPQILPFKWAFSENEIPAELRDSLNSLCQVEGPPKVDTQREFMWGTLYPCPADRPKQVRYLL